MLFGKITVELTEDAFIILAANFVVDQTIGIEQAGPFTLGQKLQSLASEGDATVRGQGYFALTAGFPVFFGRFAQ